MKIIAKVREDGALIAVCAETGERISNLTSVEQECVTRHGMIESVVRITIEDCYMLSNQPTVTE
jgi:hypothetical protein